MALRTSLLRSSGGLRAAFRRLQDWKVRSKRAFGGRGSIWAMIRAIYPVEVCQVARRNVRQPCLLVSSRLRTLREIVSIDIYEEV